MGLHRLKRERMLKKQRCKINYLSVIFILSLLFPVIKIVYAYPSSGNPSSISQASPEQLPSYPKVVFSAAAADTPILQNSSYPLIQSSRVKNVILFIGDGLGVFQITAARIRSAGATGKLYMDRMPVTGLVTDYSANNLVTDSAAAATALATGCKTNNGMVGVSPEGKKLTTILELAEKRGMATGLVVTDRITGATPASFASHVVSRNDAATIATHLLENKVDVLLGGGKEFFIPSSSPGGKRRDKRNLIEEAKKEGYLFIRNKEELEGVEAKYVLGLFELGAMITNPPEPSLAEMTRRAIDLLNGNQKGFFLMVEGSQIDWACQDNDINSAIREVLFFDKAVKEALEFALQDKHTLVIVTADHETGGLGINGGSLDGVNLEVGWTTKGHTATQVILYAFGPEAERFTGLHDNTDIPRMIAAFLGINFPFSR